MVHLFSKFILRRRPQLCCLHYLSGQPITKTCLYKFDPLKPHFYIVKLGFIGVYIIFRRGGSNEYPQSMF